MKMRIIGEASVVGFLLALSVLSAAAGGRGPGGGSFTPPGFSQGNKNGFETFTHTTTTTSPSGQVTTTTTSTKLPNGWDQGQPSWKSTLQNPNPDLNTAPPGLSK